jgi:hypothetical protein
MEWTVKRINADTFNIEGEIEIRFTPNHMVSDLKECLRAELEKHKAWGCSGKTNDLNLTGPIFQMAASVNKCLLPKGWVNVDEQTVVASVNGIGLGKAIEHPQSFFFLLEDAHFHSSSLDINAKNGHE